MSLIHLFKNMKHWNLHITGYWVIGAGCYIEKGLELGPSHPYCLKHSLKLLPLLISINYLSNKVWWLNELWFKWYIQKCTLLHVLIFIMTSLLWYIMRQLKIQKLEYLENRKILNQCFRWHILRSYPFAVEVNFNVTFKCYWEIYIFLEAYIKRKDSNESVNIFTLLDKVKIKRVKLDVKLLCNHMWGSQVIFFCLVFKFSNVYTSNALLKDTFLVEWQQYTDLC